MFEQLDEHEVKATGIPVKFLNFLWVIGAVAGVVVLGAFIEECRIAQRDVLQRIADLRPMPQQLDEAISFEQDRHKHFGQSLACAQPLRPTLNWRLSDEARARQELVMKTFNDEREEAIAIKALMQSQKKQMDYIAAYPPNYTGVRSWQKRTYLDLQSQVNGRLTLLATLFADDKC